MKLVLDAGPLLLLAAGRSMASQYKRTMAFGEAGYVALAQFVAPYSSIVTTPHVMTEAWNLTGNDDTNDYIRIAIKFNLKTLIERMTEHHRASANLIADDHFISLGLSDVAQLDAAQAERCPLVTQDRKLWRIALARGVEAIHLEDLFALSPARASSPPRPRPR